MVDRHWIGERGCGPRAAPPFASRSCPAPVASRVPRFGKPAGLPDLPAVARSAEVRAGDGAPARRAQRPGSARTRRTASTMLRSAGSTSA
ncbi:hypothetical protein GCM10027570_26030 [Streptomonospora sediminis]